MGRTRHPRRQNEVRVFSVLGEACATSLLPPCGLSEIRIQISNSERCASAFSRRGAPEFCVDGHPQKKQEGAGKAGCALHPRSRVQICTKKRTRAYRSSGGNPTFPAQWFTAYSVLSPVTGLSCHRRPREISHELDASVGAPGPHGFAVRDNSVRHLLPSRPPHPTARS
jgi:hypothetical protein